MDILGIVGLMNMVGFIFYMETISIRLNRKIRKRHFLYYMLAWIAGLCIFFSALSLITGIDIDYSAMIFQVTMVCFSLLILDCAIFIVCLHLYRRFPYFKNMFGHDALREKWKQKRKKRGEVDKDENKTNGNVHSKRRKC